jgi:hypothetical protein
MATARTWLGSTDRHARLRKIESLDPEKDYALITRLFFEDFGNIMMVPAFTGFMMNFAAPRISRILGATGEIEHRVAKRFLDTALLARNVSQHGLGKPGPGRDAARRVNSMHRRYDIHEDDFIIVSCDQLVMTLKTVGKYGWRPITDAERRALLLHYAEETRYFGGRKPIPPTLEEAFAFWENYMDTQLAYEPQNKRMADAMLGFMKTLFPLPLRPFVAPMLLAQVDPRILRATGMPEQGPLARKCSGFLLHLVSKQDPLPDNTPDGLQKLINSVYPNGYSIDTLGTHVEQPRAAAPQQGIAEALQND